LEAQATGILAEAAVQLRHLAAAATDRAVATRFESALRGLEADRRFLEQGAHGAPRLETADPEQRLLLLAAQESERARLAQEIHDGPAQAMANAIFQVDIIRRALETRPDQAVEELRALRDQLRDELADLRSFINQLRPPLLEEMGLDRALSESAVQLAGSGGPAVELDLAAPDDLLDETRQTVVLRVAQEALRNVHKHAHAHHVRVTTRHEPAADGSSPHWILEVTDDGRGWQAHDAAAGRPGGGGHFGLRFMQERAAMIGAQFDIHAVADSGTTVRLTITLS
ncbi:MAG: sensor histidine kinase, partial [Candidatus Limnocylindrales bacterium]